jgi:hypothetical protein
MPHLRCRQIRPADLEAVADLLTRGFRNRSREFWAARLERLSEHPAPPDHPKYGYIMECEGVPVGVILLIFSAVARGAETKIRCYVSSLYVDPEFRGHAAMLASYALRYRHVTYMNVTPPRYTWPMLQAQGYERYCSGRFIAAPALSTGCGGAELAALKARPDRRLPPLESELLLRHVQFGCISVTCSCAGEAHPFVFAPRRKGLLRYARLVYCRRAEDFIQFSGVLGRFLAKRGILLVVLDANGPIKGLIGIYLGGSPAYFKGPDPPTPGDLAYSPGVVFKA